MIQTGAVSCCCVGLLFFTPLRTATTRALAGGNLADPILRWCPLAWFVGCSTRPSAERRAQSCTRSPFAGCWRGTVPVAATIALYILAFRRLCARAIETPARCDFVGPRDGGVGGRPPDICETSRGAGTLRLYAPRAHPQSASSDAAVDLRRRCACTDRRRAAAGDPEWLAQASFRQPTVGTLAAPLILSAALAVGFRTLLADSCRPSCAVGLSNALRCRLHAP